MSLFNEKKPNQYNQGIWKQAEEINDKYFNKVPIYKGCGNTQCFCSGACREIVGWREKSQLEIIQDNINKPPML